MDQIEFFRLPRLPDFGDRAAHFVKQVSQILGRAVVFASDGESFNWHEATVPAWLPLRFRYEILHANSRFVLFSYERDLP